MISDNPNVSVGFVDCLLYTPRIALKEYYHRKKMPQFTLVMFYCLETQSKTFILPTRQNQFIQENIFNKDQAGRISMFTNFPFWYQKFDLRQVRKLKGGQPTVKLDAADDCSFYATKKKATNFQDDIPSVPMEDFKDHYVL